jgi:hypothetical protein
MKQNDQEMNIIKASELEAIFDANDEDILPYLDLSKATVRNNYKKINIDCPEWLVNGLDKKAAHLGITRQSLIKVWLADKLENDNKTT